ncbi:hypothetical protein [Streptomyces sp. NBRC 109706]|uniref:hypothetical protein n=1 Tax=Streptomyces sp. NBRC 109706 TaxID=1550035 RepID=UPI00078322B9|nr:hypothetical protein [Streptomyces sp. NBRC 109706]
MILIYEPADQPAERYDLDDLGAIEAEAIERVTGKTWAEVEQALQQQSPTALRACLWVWHKRKTPSLRFSDFDVPGWRKRLKARMSTGEVAETVAAVQREYPEDTPDFAQALRELRFLAEDPADVQAALDGQGPKEALPAA